MHRCRRPGQRVAQRVGKGLVVLAASWVDIGRKIGYRPIGRLAIIAEEKPIQLVNQLA